MSLKGKHAVISGASNGIGRQTALSFADEGAAALYLMGRDSKALEEVAKLCREKGSTVTTYAGDLLEAAYWESELVKLKSIERIDVLVNNAGWIMGYGPLERCDDEQFERTWRLNVDCVRKLTQFCLPAIRKSKGNIIMVSSIAGIRPYPNLMSYSVSKGALEQMNRNLAMEEAANGVRVNSVCPGTVVTQLAPRTYAGATPEQMEAFFDGAKKSHPLGRVGQPIDVANAIVFLASDAASWITGASLPVDGGRHAAVPSVI